MRHVARILVALTAVIAIALSSAVGLTLWRMWKHPFRLCVERTSSGLRWRECGLSAELTLSGGAFEQLVVWRSAAMP